ncbi:MAG TPA: porin [Burkholderiales bacterium]|nr:porin [Burkholderiales bacterium]
MKKSLIAVAVAGLFAAPAAMAEVTISGAINVGVSYGKSSDMGNGQSKTVTGIASGGHYSHLDIESVDDIGGGNKVIMHYQFDISGTSTAGFGSAGGAVGNRNSYIGIAGGWGAVKVGTNENVYERMLYTADPLDGAAGAGGNLNLLGIPGGLGFAVGQNPAGGATGCCSPAFGPGGAGGDPGFYRRANQVIWYESPNWNGFSFEVDQTMSAYKQTIGGSEINPMITSLGGKFAPDGAPFYISAAWEQHKDMFGINFVAQSQAGTSTVTNSKDNAYMIGAGWKFSSIGLGLDFIYEHLDYKADGGTVSLGGNIGQTGVDDYKRDAYWIGAKYDLPSGYLGAEFGIAEDGKTNVGKANDTGAKMFAIGYYHNLSKQSQLQFVYARTDNDDNANYIQFDAPSGALGSTNQAFEVNIKHTF